MASAGLGCHREPFDEHVLATRPPLPACRERWDVVPATGGPCRYFDYRIIGPFWPPPVPLPPPKFGIGCRIGAVVLARNWATLPTLVVLPTDDPPPLLNTLRPPLPRPIT